MHINSFSNNYYQPVFYANNRKINNNKGELLYKTTTYFFRDDLDWDILTDYLCHKYKNTDKVNIICHACSNGSEPYSLAMRLMAFHENDSGKFLPILAKDLDFENIRCAKKGLCEADNNDLYRIDFYTKSKYRDYLIPQKNFLSNKSIIMSPKQILKEKVNFEQGDIFKDIENIPKENTVLFCKNFWPYLSETKRELLAKKLGSKLGKSSLVIIGDFDSLRSDVRSLLSKNGFRENPYVINVWEKLK
ncbi:hypothetical protein J6G99_04235 [bacterium]|nr:hypothetical protein [bacterium]